MPSHLIPRLLNWGYPCLVLKVWAPDETIRRFLKGLEGQVIEGEQLIALLHSIARDVRLGTTFDPDHWWIEHRWSYYGYPAETLIRYAPHVRYLVEMWSPELMDKWLAYVGIGVSPYEHGEPIAVLFEYPLKPRKCVSFKIIEEGTGYYRIKAITAHPRAKEILKSFGYVEQSPYELVKTYRGSFDKVAEELCKIDQKLRDAGFFTFMLEGLRERVKRYVLV